MLNPHDVETKVHKQVFEPGEGGLEKLQEECVQIPADVLSWQKLRSKISKLQRILCKKAWRKILYKKKYKK